MRPTSSAAAERSGETSTKIAISHTNTVRRVASSSHDTAEKQRGSSSCSTKVRENTTTPVFLLDKFNCFRKLSLELQLMIWKLSLKPRILELRFSNDITSTQFYILGKVPVQLHINREIRTEFLKSYKLLFAHKNGRRPVYFNSEIDTLHFQDSLIGRGTPWYHQFLRATIKQLPDKCEIRHLSVTDFICSIDLLLKWAETPLVLMFPRLKTMSVSFRLRTAFNISNGHTGPCNTEIQGGVCFLDLDSVKLYNKVPSSGKDTRLENVKLIVKKILDQVSNNKWGPLEWQVPVIKYKAACMNNFFEGDWYCPPLGLGRAPAKSEMEAKKNALKIENGYYRIYSYHWRNHLLNSSKKEIPQGKEEA